MTARAGGRRAADPGGWGPIHFALRGWALAAALAAVAAARWESDAPLRPAWLLLWAAGCAWRAWAGFHIGPHSNGRSWSGARIASGGPYRISRHPLYFANLLCAAGLVLYADCLPGWAEGAALALVFLQHEGLARGEEAYLLAAPGGGYRGYMQVTPRWPGPGSMRFRAAGPARGGPEAGAAAAAGPDGERAAGWREALARQGANLAKAGAGIALIGLAAAIR